MHHSTGYTICLSVYLWSEQSVQSRDRYTAKVSEGILETALLLIMVFGSGFPNQLFQNFK